MPRQSDCKRIKQPLKDNPSPLSSSARPPVRRSSRLAGSTSSALDYGTSSSSVAVYTPVGTLEPVEATRKRCRATQEEKEKEVSTSSGAGRASTEREETSRPEKKAECESGSDKLDKALPLLKRRKVASPSPSPSTPSSSTLSTDIVSAAGPPPSPPPARTPHLFQLSNLVSNAVLSRNSRPTPLPLLSPLPAPLPDALSSLKHPFSLLSRRGRLDHSMERVREAGR